MQYTFLSTLGSTPATFCVLTSLSLMFEQNKHTKKNTHVPDLIFSVVFLYFLCPLDLYFLNMIHLCDVLWICLKYVNCSIKNLIEISLAVLTLTLYMHTRKFKYAYKHTYMHYMTVKLKYCTYVVHDIYILSTCT